MASFFLQLVSCLSAGPRPPDDAWSCRWNRPPHMPAPPNLPGLSSGWPTGPTGTPLRPRPSVFASHSTQPVRWRRWPIAGPGPPAPSNSSSSRGAAAALPSQQFPRQRFGLRKWPPDRWPRSACSSSPRRRWPMPSATAYPAFPPAPDRATRPGRGIGCTAGCRPTLRSMFCRQRPPPTSTTGRFFAVFAAPSAARIRAI